MEHKQYLLFNCNVIAKLRAKMEFTLHDRNFFIGNLIHISTIPISNIL